MLNFKLHTTPPTAAEIEEEKNRLLAEKTRLKRRTYAWGILGVIISAAVIVSLQAADYKEVAVAVAEVVVGAGALAVLVAGVVAGALVETLLGSKFDRVDHLLRRLKFLPDATMGRAQKILSFCRQDKICDAYRKAVANLDRPLTIGEADMIEQRVCSADTRKSEHDNQQALAQLQNRELLFR